MSALRRFIYVVSPTGRKLHRIYKSRYAPVEGDKTACGMLIATTWRAAGLGDKIINTGCKRCENAAG